MTYIPFAFGGADENTAAIGSAPLHSLAEMNIGHFRSDCDNRDNLHYHGQGMTNYYKEDDNEAGLDVGASGLNQLRVGEKVEILQIASTGAIAAEM